MAGGIQPESANSNSDPFSALIGERADGCWLGYGSALFLEFGERQTASDLKNQKSGEWSMQCGTVLWRIEQGDSVLAASNDDRAIMEAALDRLNSRLFVSGKLCDTTGDSVLEFADGIVLRIFVLTSEEDARWLLRKGEGEFLPIGPNLVERQERDQ